MFTIIYIYTTMKKSSISYQTVLFLTCLVWALCTSSPKGWAAKGKHTFSITGGQFLYDGKPIQIHSGELHYARIPAPYWRHRIQMMKAMGLNTVATYVFWNHHEIAPGVWDWKTGNRNLREFLKIAADEDMLVILRPGPYVCAEWEFGGYPWWLLKTPGMKIRTLNQPFLDSCKVYIQQLAAQVGDLQITKGGPIVMVQAENEFGSYVSQRKDIPKATHKEYAAAICTQLKEAGFDVPRFTSDGSWLFEEGALPGILPTCNGENNIEKIKTVVDKYNGGTGPYMVAEFYPGWLDHWNEAFIKVSTETVTKQLKKYLDANIHFNFYMVHGGTNFAFTSGANYTNKKNIQPDLTSYDYDAPISEAGWDTPKYHAIRNMLQEHSAKPLPEIPARIPVITIPDIKIEHAYKLFNMLEQQPTENDKMLTFEDLDQGHGYVLYRRHFNQPISGMLRAPGIADFGVVYVGGQKVGELNRLTGKDSLMVEVPFNSTLDILVENCGRINYGARITNNKKGFLKTITIDDNPIEGGWQHYQLSMSQEPVFDGAPDSYEKGQPVIYQGSFTVDKVGDTFLDMESWGKGIVFVNGVNLGRYWKVGPQQTLYLPGCFLKKGKNRITIFEQLNDERKTTLQGVDQPVLERLKKE